MKNSLPNIVRAFMVFLFCMQAATWIPAATPPQQTWEAEGAQLAFDGVFYSYSHPEGQGIKLWVPPGEAPVRGIILFGNPGGGMGGDTRDKSRQPDLLAFAARHRFGVAGVSGFPGRETYDRYGKRILEALKSWGERGQHPELAHIPMVVSGSSNAGVFSFAMLRLAPERIIAITPNVGASYGDTLPAAALGVPAWMHIGVTDPLVVLGVEATEKLFAEHAAKGPLWTFEAEIKGHENGASDHVDFAFWDAVIPLRLPVDQGPRDQAVKLRPIDPSTGWRADFRTWDHTITKIFPASQPLPYPEQPERYGWLPTEGIARLYQAAATRSRNLLISFDEKSKTSGGATSGVYLSSGGSVLAKPGDQVKIKLALAPLQRPPEVVEFYDRAEKLGEIDARTTSEFVFTVDNRALYALHARAGQPLRDSKNTVPRVSNPLQLIVQDPALTVSTQSQLDSVAWAATYRSKAEDPEKLKLLGPATESPATLMAPSVSSEEAKAFTGSAPSAFWDRLAAQHPPTALHPSGFSTKVHTQAAASDRGLHLRFTIMDKAPADAKPGEMDFHLASVGLAAVLERPATTRDFSWPLYSSTLRRAMQYSTTAWGEPQIVTFNFWNPWNREKVQLETAVAREQHGLILHRSTLADGSQQVEWLIPWAMVGNPGLTKRPATGSSLAVALGYNPSSSNEKIRWPHQLDPWSQPAAGATPSPVYGQIVIAD